MKKYLLGSVALIALGCAPAFAADLSARAYTKAPAPAYMPAPIYNWTGFYIGGHIGGAFNGGDNIFGDNGRFIGGVQGGADLQFAPNWVVGIEAQYSWSGSSSTTIAYAPGYTIEGRNGDLGSVTGRLGYTWGPALLYAKGGLAFRGDNKGVSVYDTATGITTSYTAGRNDTGYTVGAGLEYMFAPSWSGKVEYQYYNFGTDNVTVAYPYSSSVSWRDDVHTVKAGLNYRFNWGAPQGPAY